MKVIETDLPQVLILEPTVYQDSRGFFMEMYQESRYFSAGVQEKFVQDNISSSGKNIVRGLHYQLKNPQGKLVSVLRGKVFDVIVDLRQGSPHFSQWIGVELSAENKRQVYIPPGFAHGFCSLTEDVLFHYKCTQLYDTQDEYGILWSDPALQITWPLAEQANVSEKDNALPVLAELSPQQLPVFE
jgi:dTDP-4-dehydrorhamnose 3,5-epimerase